MSPAACPCPHCRWHRIINAELSARVQALEAALDAFLTGAIWGDVPGPTQAQSAAILANLRAAIAALPPPPADDIPRAFRRAFGEPDR